MRGARCAPTASTDRRAVLDFEVYVIVSGRRVRRGRWPISGPSWARHRDGSAEIGYLIHRGVVVVNIWRCHFEHEEAEAEHEETAESATYHDVESKGDPLHAN